MSAFIQVTVAHAPAPRQVHEQTVTLPAHSTVGQALAAAGLLEAFLSEYGGAERALGVWGRKATLGQALRDRDRVELWRPLRVDPKLARRERFDQQGVRGAGLFAKRRPGAKPGY